MLIQSDPRIPSHLDSGINCLAELHPLGEEFDALSDVAIADVDHKALLEGLHGLLQASLFLQDAGQVEADVQQIFILVSWGVECQLELADGQVAVALLREAQGQLIAGHQILVGLGSSPIVFLNRFLDKAELLIEFAQAKVRVGVTRAEARNRLVFADDF